MQTDYVDSYYSRTRATDVEYAPLQGMIEADVCVIGGGIAGLSTAWELTQRGLSVVVLEKNRLAWGASGRNGGILGAGFAGPDSGLERAGPKAARALYDLSREGVRTVIENTTNLNLKGVDPVAGRISVSRYPDAKGMQDSIRTTAEKFDHHKEYLSTEKLRELVNSDRFFDGYFDPESYHIHPLNYCKGLAHHIVQTGGQVFEHSAMISMDHTGAEKHTHTAQGCVKSKYVVMCGSGYGGPEFGKTYNSLLPIATYVISTKNLGGRLDGLMNTKAAVGDTRLSCDYFRVTPTGELLWGGGMSGLAKSPANLAELMKNRVLEVFPQLADVEVDVAWTGLMGYSRHKMPYVQEVAPNVWTATALGGHGLNTGPAIARVVAEAIAENGTRHELFAPFGLRWNGSVFGPIAADMICAASNFGHKLRERFMK
ncbi:NAD(P)/FAD-dependent oxidoreductase [Halocynthiibacter namhaensis]|uniref:NAD(P)/FAD-dependent oxidoreductase n=1 Tax=Halocynthiibacter namhaensis TaxID=1290553 RepID=UPI000578E9B4|nr:FAD-binding oxidoreductase [Halocynthiibacter namhaensis]